MSSTKLTRAQLAQFLPDARAIRTFEELIKQSEQVGNAPDTQGISISADNAGALSIENAAAIQRIKNAVELLATAHAEEKNTSTITDYIDLPESAPHAAQARRVQWNSDDGTLDVGLYGDSVLQVGQETMYYAKNTSGSTIANGTPVMFNGAVGASGKLAFTKAISDGSVAAEYMMGVATQDIISNAFGYVTTFGLVRGFDTTGSAYGEVWSDGDLLYFSSTTAGAWTKTQPVAPAIKKPVGVVVHAGSGGSGSVFVRMDLAEAISKLQDVNISSIANNDILLWNSSNNRWQNSPIAATSWTPSFTCATVGDLSVVYATRVGRYTRIGDIVTLSYSITFTPTFATASGNAQITGLPISAGSAMVAIGSVSGKLPALGAGLTQLNTSLASSDNKMTLVASGSAIASATKTISDFVSGTSYTINGTLTYYA